MTSLETPPQPDPEIWARKQAETVRCPRCASPPGRGCDMTRYPPPHAKASRTYHKVRLTMYDLTPHPTSERPTQ